MKKIHTLFALLLFAFVLSSQAYSQTPAEADPADASTQTYAEMNFQSELIDYGTIDNGADGVRIFQFTNTGEAPLKITSARGSCGCTVPQWPREEIAPGESGEIKVTYDTKRTGPFSKSVTLNYNGSPAIKVLKIKGVVNKPEPAPSFDAPQTAPAVTPAEKKQ